MPTRLPDCFVQGISDIDIVESINQSFPALTCLLFNPTTAEHLDFSNPLAEPTGREPQAKVAIPVEVVLRSTDPVS